MSISFFDMVNEAKQNVTSITSLEVKQKLRANPDILVIDVQDATDAGQCGLIPASINISLGMLPIRADLEVPEELQNKRLANRHQSIIVTCGAGGQAALGAYLLKKMGFTDVAFIDGGTSAWKKEGFEVV